MANLKTNYKDQLLDTSVNTERKFNLVDSDGNVIASGVSLRDITQYSQTGDTFGAADINKITATINEQNNNLGGNTLTYNESEDAYYIQHGADSVPKKLGEVEVVVETVSGATYTTVNGIRTLKYYIGTGYRYVGLLSYTGKYGNSVGSGDYKTYTTDISYDPDTGYITMTSTVWVYDEVTFTYIAVK